MVAFNTACVWIDAREFDRLEPEQAIALYRGPLLPGAHAEQWSLEARDRLRHRFIQAVDKIGVRAQHRAEWLAAHEIYQRALEVEPAAEQLHQGAIRCQLAMGLHGEAVAAYRRCERALRSTFGVQPSETTRRLLESLQSVNKR
jgi:LuxR family transcriptional regulator, maltose regulon positive regulatory protein